MDVGICVGAQISDIDYIVLAEELGYDSVWVADSQMIWSDCYATLALAAARTRRIKLGTGVAVAGTRIAPVTASAIASINQIAPGRVFLGLGTGHTAMRTMGHDQMGLREFKDYARVVRDLLDGKTTSWTHNGRAQDITLMHQGKGYYALEPRIPIHISGFGPQTQRWAGAWADSLVLAGARPEAIATAARNAREGAAKAGRALTRDFEISTLINSIVLEPGETLETERAIEETGSLVSSGLHYAWEVAREPKRDLSNAPGVFAGIWQEYCDYVEAMDLPGQREVPGGSRRALQLAARARANVHLARGYPLLQPLGHSGADCRADRGAGTRRADEDAASPAGPGATQGDHRFRRESHALAADEGRVLALVAGTPTFRCTAAFASPSARREPRGRRCARHGRSSSGSTRCAARLPGLG
jgi:hypothetical protein